MDLPPTGFADVRERREWIRKQLMDLKGLSFADVARDMKLSPTSITQGLLGSSMPVEHVICQHLDIAHKDLFPERYARNGALKSRPRGNIPVAA